ncbi:MAG: DoxX family protein [Chloroflexi bacterium]|nr:DoxX family protein [Chloroflexota bacterium]
MTDLAILILRLFLGIVMIPHGVHKLQIRDVLDKKWRDEYGFPVGSVVLTGIIQIVGGVALILGVYGRYNALIQAVIMVVATYVSIWKHREPFPSLPTGKGWDVNFLLVGAFVVLMLLGDGSWALLGW